MTGKLSKNFHGVGIGPLSKILAVKKAVFHLDDKYSDYNQEDRRK